MWRAALFFLAATAPVQAAECSGPSMRFVESAPRDRFELTVGDVALRAVRIDLRRSAGRLIFDTASGGTGVQVFQPLRDEGGTEAGEVADGAEAVKVLLRDGGAGTRAVFSIDVDDRLTSSELGQIRVTGSEIEGATVVFEGVDGSSLKATFDQKSIAKSCS